MWARRGGGSSAWSLERCHGCTTVSPSWGIMRAWTRAWSCTSIVSVTSCPAWGGVSRVSWVSSLVVWMPRSPRSAVSAPRSIPVCPMDSPSRYSDRSGVPSGSAAGRGRGVLVPVVFLVHAVAHPPQDVRGHAVNAHARRGLRPDREGEGRAIDRDLHRFERVLACSGVDHGHPRHGGRGGVGLLLGVGRAEKELVRDAVPHLTEEDVGAGLLGDGAVELPGLDLRLDAGLGGLPFKTGLGVGPDAGSEALDILADRLFARFELVARDAAEEGELVPTWRQGGPGSRARSARRARAAQRGRASPIPRGAAASPGGAPGRTPTGRR